MAKQGGTRSSVSRGRQMVSAFVVLLVAASWAAPGTVAAGIASEPALTESEPAPGRSPVPDDSLPPLNLENPLLSWYSENALDITTSVPPDGGLGCGDADPDSFHPCWAYRLRVEDPAEALHVTIDTNRRGECYEFQVWRPGSYDEIAVLEPGKWWPRTTSFSNCPRYFPFGREVWNGEVQVQDPEVGEWVVRVIPLEVRDWGFRLRAELVVDTAAPVGVEVLPNLQPIPPYEFTFSAPTHRDPGKAYDHENGGSDPTKSCIADDTPEGGDPPQRCLRFSAAGYNVGEGDLELRFKDSETSQQGPVVQYIRDDSGAVVRELPAGEWRDHEAHGHRHYEGYSRFELYRVWGPAAPHKRLELVTLGAKWGWNFADQRIADWETTNEGKAAASSDACFAISEGDECMGQTRGWGDHYRWQRPGNYVEFPVDETGLNVDGDYVLRMTLDDAGRIAESDETDNVAYSWIRVDGGDVLLCERGLGESPWDPHKEVLEAGFWVSTPGGTTAESAVSDCGFERSWEGGPPIPER